MAHRLAHRRMLLTTPPAAQATSVKAVFALIAAMELWKPANNAMALPQEPTPMDLRLAAAIPLVRKNQAPQSVAVQPVFVTLSLKHAVLAFQPMEHAHRITHSQRLKAVTTAPLAPITINAPAPLPPPAPVQVTLAPHLKLATRPRELLVTETIPALIRI